jgi:hypothetical protein
MQHCDVKQRLHNFASQGNHGSSSTNISPDSPAYQGKLRPAQSQKAKLTKMPVTTSPIFSNLSKHSASKEADSLKSSFRELVVQRVGERSPEGTPEKEDSEVFNQFFSAKPKPTKVSQYSKYIKSNTIQAEGTQRSNQGVTQSRNRILSSEQKAPEDKRSEICGWERATDSGDYVRDYPNGAEGFLSQLKRNQRSSENETGDISTAAPNFNTAKKTRTAKIIRLKLISAWGKNNITGLFSIELFNTEGKPIQVLSSQVTCTNCGLRASNTVDSLFNAKKKLESDNNWNCVLGTGIKNQYGEILISLPLLYSLKRVRVTY